MLKSFAVRAKPFFRLWLCRGDCKFTTLRLEEIVDDLLFIFELPETKAGMDLRCWHLELQVCPLPNLPYMDPSLLPV
jgi:hypothetical protein